MPNGERMSWHDLEAALTARGIEHLGFISFARDRPPKALVALAFKVKQAIEQELSYYVNSPRLFFDEEAMKGGDYLEASLGSGICKSVCVIAVCAPVYFDRPYCGREWAAMEDLTTARFPAGQRQPTIIPILLRKLDPPLPMFSGPEAVKYYDISQESVRRGYFTSPKFRLLAKEIVEQVRTLGEALVRTDARCDGGPHALPLRSAFAQYSRGPVPFPLRERTAERP